MKITLKNTRTTTAVIIALMLSSCVRFDTRMQANGSFEYQNVTLTTAYKTGEFSNDEARDTYVLPELTEKQKQVGFATTDVDLRPPSQFMAVIDGVLLEKTEDGSTKVWFNAFNQSDNMQEKVWSLLEAYMAKFDAELLSNDKQRQDVAIGNITEITTYGRYFNVNTVVKETSYQFTTENQPDSHRVALIVDVLSYKETNDDVELKVNLVGSRKNKIEIRFVNALLAYAYQIKQSEQLVNADTKPLTIKLGFDGNHQNIWIVESEFMDTWRNLPTLLTLLNFEIVEDDKNLGYFLLNYIKPIPAYWLENDLQSFDLLPNEYFIQLGELSDGKTSILWLDEDKKPLSDQMVTEIYLSISKHIRSALLKGEKQTHEF